MIRETKDSFGNSALGILLGRAMIILCSGLGVALMFAAANYYSNIK